MSTVTNSTLGWSEQPSAQPESSPQASQPAISPPPAATNPMASPSPEPTAAVAKEHSPVSSYASRQPLSTEKLLGTERTETAKLILTANQAWANKNYELFFATVTRLPVVDVQSAGMYLNQAAETSRMLNKAVAIKHLSNAATFARERKRANLYTFFQGRIVAFNQCGAWTCAQTSAQTGLSQPQETEPTVLSSPTRAVKPTKAGIPPEVDSPNSLPHPPGDDYMPAPGAESVPGLEPSKSSS